MCFIELLTGVPLLCFVGPQCAILHHLASAPDRRATGPLITTAHATAAAPGTVGTAPRSATATATTTAPPAGTVAATAAVTAPRRVIAQIMGGTAPAAKYIRWDCERLFEGVLKCPFGFCTQACLEPDLAMVHMPGIVLPLPFLLAGSICEEAIAELMVPGTAADRA